MEVHRYSDPVRFGEKATPALLEEEARHNLLLGLITTLVESPDFYPRFHLWLVEEGREVLAAGIVTPPFNVAVSRPRHGSAIAALVRAVHEDGIQPPGVTGSVPEVEEFVSAWRKTTGQAARLEMNQRIYQLRSVRAAAAAPGSMRRAGSGDRDLVVSWVIDFVREAGVGHDDDELRETERRVRRRLEGEGVGGDAGAGAGYFLWEDGAPVSLVGYGGFTPNGARIGPVYTPPDLRGRGYASALTAGVSGWLLEQGRRLCFLYTDLANPTSNRIYQRIGYEPVCDSAQYRFAPSTPPARAN